MQTIVKIALELLEKSEVERVCLERIKVFVEKGGLSIDSLKQLDETGQLLRQVQYEKRNVLPKECVFYFILFFIYFRSVVEIGGEG